MRLSWRPAGIPPAVWFLTALTVFAAAYASWPVSAVKIESRDVVTTVTVPAGSELYLDYLHSVARVPIREVFVLNDRGGFVLIRTEHSGFGAGLPTESFGDFRLVDGVYINSGIDLPLSDIPLRVSIGSEQKLTFQDGSEVVLLDFFDANNLVVIRSRRLPRAGYIFWRKRFS